MPQATSVPGSYAPQLELKETQRAICLIKDFFQQEFAAELNLLRVSAPLFVMAGTGINDNLNGVEKPISFCLKNMDGVTAEIVQSLAKWKRLKLAEYGFGPGEGLYTDMNAIRPDETPDRLHSFYVDQWDWERVMTAEERTLEFLKNVVRRIFAIIRKTENRVCHHYPQLKPILPETISFVHSEELEDRYPNATAPERELHAAREHGAIFVIGIGGRLRKGGPHDGRSPDYDDWSTSTTNGFKGLNGDIVIHYPVLDCALELSSMGIRVDAAALARQLQITGHVDRSELYFHRRLLNNELPLSIGGGVGQSRMCMLLLRKAHIGEVQVGLWPEAMADMCARQNICLL